MFQRSTGECHFFSCLPPRLDADRIDEPQDDQCVCQQLQGPMASPLGRIAARQTHQGLLDIPLDFDLVRAWGLGLGVEGGVDTLRHKPFTNPFYTPEAGPQGQDDLVISIRQHVGRIGQQKHTSMGQLACRRSADRNQFCQGVLFVCCQSHPLLFHSRIPFLGAISIATTP